MKWIFSTDIHKSMYNVYMSLDQKVNNKSDKKKYIINPNWSYNYND